MRAIYLGLKIKIQQTGRRTWRVDVCGFLPDPKVGQRWHQDCAYAWSEAGAITKGRKMHARLTRQAQRVGAIREVTP